MGGKQKQAQRTKNNTRPSNSSRSAELLAFGGFGGTSVPSFVNSLSALKETKFPTTLSAVACDDIDASIDVNFQLVFKKMNKKDAVTKVKALNEFMELLNETDPDTIKSVLPLWPRPYCMLSMDVDNKVRECANLAHKQIVIKAKRNLAPYLKSLVGAWFVAQFDAYPPAASAATQAFEEAFPGNKLKDAITFCQEEILNHIYDNLVVHTADTLSNLKICSQEDANAKYERILIASLNAYSLYFKMVSPESVKKCENLNLKILESDKFKKYTVHELTQVRSCWFLVIKSVYEQVPFLLESKAKVAIVKAVFLNLSETDPVVLPNVWEAALIVVSTIPDWYTHINVEQMFFSKLWKIFREAANGSAAVIFPNLLPIIAHLPPNIATDSFYTKFFSNLQTGFAQKSIKASQAETRALATAFMECFQYVIKKLNDNVDFCLDLIDTQLFPLIDNCLELKGFETCYKIVFNQLAFMVQYWHRTQTQEGHTHYTKILSVFWTKLLDVFCKKLKSNSELKEIIQRQVELLISIKHPVKAKKSLKISFSGDSEQRCLKENTVRDETFLIAVNELSQSLLMEYFARIDQVRDFDALQEIAALIQDFATADYLKNLDVYSFYKNTLKKWLMNENSVLVVDLLFSLFLEMTDDQKNEVLLDLLKLNTTELEVVFARCCAAALAHPYNSLQLVQDWLKRDEIGTFMVHIMEKEINDEGTPEMRLLLKQALCENLNGDIFINQKAIAIIVKLLSEAILHPLEHPTIDTLASLSAYLAAIIYTENLKLAYGDQLLLSLVALGTSENYDPDTLSADTIWEVNTAWQDAILVLSAELSETDMHKLTLKFAESIVSAKSQVMPIIGFVKSIKYTPNVTRVIDTLFERSSMLPWRKAIADLVEISLSVKGALIGACLSDINLDSSKIDEEDVCNYFQWINVQFSVLASDIEEDEYNDVDEEENSERKMWFNLYDKSDAFFVELLFNITLLEELVFEYRGIKCHTRLQEILNEINKTFASIQNKINIKDAIFKKICQCDTLSTLDNSIRIQSLKTYLNKMYQTDVNMQRRCYNELNSKLKERSINNITLIQLMQTFANVLSYDHIDHNMDVLKSVVALRYFAPGQTEIDVQIAGAFRLIDQYKDATYSGNIYSANLDSSKDLLLLSEINRCLAVLLRNSNESMPQNHWDFSVISLGNWCDRLKLIKSFNKVGICSFAQSTADLFISVILFLRRLRDTDPSHRYIDEWNNVFAASIFTDIIKVWSNIAGYFSKNISISSLPFLQQFGQIITYVDAKYIFGDQKTIEWTVLQKQCIGLLSSPVHCLQLWGYHCLMMLSDGFMELDNKAVTKNTPHEKGFIFGQFKELQVKTQEIVHTLLQDFILGEDSCKVQPFTDSYTYTFSYILIWDILFHMCENATIELRFHYCDWLKKEELFDNFLNHIFKLMPIEVLHEAGFKSTNLAPCFTEKSGVSFYDDVTSARLERMACSVYTSALSNLPASVRLWLTTVDSKTSQIVEKITESYVSSYLCKNEIQYIYKNRSRLNNIDIRSRSTREIVAVYTVDGCDLELEIALPMNYPLAGPVINCKHLAASNKHVLMQLSLCVTHQNGHLLDAIILWTEFLNKKFDGINECYICYAVLHPGSLAIPKMACKTCRKKFHSPCLYKWFSTSQKSTCPICRNLF